MHAPLTRKRGRPKKEHQPIFLGPDNKRQSLRLQALALHLEYRYSHMEIAAALQCSRSSVTSWMKTWERGGLDALLQKKLPPKRSPHLFTCEAREALLAAIPTHTWTTAREAWIWVRDELKIKVCYLTVWRFLTAQGFFVGDTPRARRFAPSLDRMPSR
jgi:transposase